ncbi:MAG: polysaccharide biosynthesis protein, partial [Mogibacterium sp.]|nr:polysaccharide biosynthesis protein [Mogibacterium sp.]
MEDSSNQLKQQKNKTGFRMEHWMQISVYLIIYDAIAVSMAYFLALLIRFDFNFSMIPVVYLRPWMYFAPVYAVICIAVFWQLRLYKSIWRFASFTELERIRVASVITTILHIIGVTIVMNVLIDDTAYTMNRMPISYYLMGAILQAIFVTAVRFSYRFELLLRATRDKKEASRIMLIGMYSKI